MTRACATALALVNWKGVFYERYLLDRHVTALEGANGAGKTTVMIAAYVVLMPDLARLRFTNLGETAATGGDRGLYGRLGEPGRPSFAAMEVALGDGSRLIAGVQLERKSEPSLELTPFLVSGLDLQGRLKELLLVSSPDSAHDDVPSLAQVRENAARLGGKLQVFSSAKDYFGALFERGINPLRLATEEERSKLHDMLRTSMTGGISRALTSELRSFLLKEETGLADTLARMRANLAACRRTRIEVAEARALEREITAVHEAGSAMVHAFSASLRAARVSASAQREEAQARMARTEADHAELERQKHEREATQRQLKERIEHVRVALQNHTIHRERVRTVRRLSEQLEAAGLELAAAESQEKKAREKKDETLHARETAREVREKARTAYERAARGLGDLQAGLEELHHRAHTQRLARARLQEARELLENEELAAETVDLARCRVSARLAEIDALRARADRETALQESHQNEYAKALEALEQVATRAASTEPSEASFGAHTVVGENDLYERARSELSRLAGLEHVASRGRITDLEAEIAVREAERQHALGVREKAVSLGITFEAAENAPAALDVALAQAEAELHAHENDLRTAELEAGDAARRARESESLAVAAEALMPRWDALAPMLERLSRNARAAQRPLLTASDVAEARCHVTEAREVCQEKIRATEALRMACVRDAEALEQACGVAPDLLILRDLLTAELLATRFETTSVDEAAWLEAALGPLAHALVVDDPAMAAEILAQQREAPETVWLVAEDDVPRLIDAVRAHAGSPETPDVVVEEAYGLRVTRKSARPLLGREARLERARALRGEAERAGAELTALYEEARAAGQLLRDADSLLGEAELLAAGNPASRAEAARLAEREAREIEKLSQIQARSSKSAAALVRGHLEALRSLAREIHVVVTSLGLKAEASLAELRRSRETALAASRELARTADARAVLERTIEALRHPQPSTGSLEKAANERASLERERDRLFAAHGALVDVCERKEALAGPDVDASLGAQSEVRAAVEAQHDSALAASVTAENAMRDVEKAFEQASLVWQAAEGVRASCEAACARLRTELENAGGSAPENAPTTTLESLDGVIASVMHERQTLENHEREITPEIAVVRERLTHAAQSLTRVRADVAVADVSANAAEAAWREFSREAAARGGVGVELPPAVDETNTPMALSPAEFLAEARAQRALLLTRLEHCRGGADGVAAVRDAMSSFGDSARGYLGAWKSARAWVMRRLPSQFASVIDPGEALERLRADLTHLAARVEHHEVDLRGTSEDVARGIDVQLRKTATRVRRLNRDLARVAFGSIAAVRVTVKRVERMALVLRALRGGEMQELLFQSDLPFEEALGEVFKRYGGGGKSGPQRLLDYREYVDLTVEIQRRGGSLDWEAASPTRLSTGEAIGVGAALMMVVLTEWERDANLLRAGRSSGTLRFLFLDEANRLSPDNLAVLFDLCRALDLQLLVAAPEVARARGNTTYRLVRHVAASGREEVLVTGRRTADDTPQTLDPPMQAP